MIGQQIKQYRIDALLGRGGMATVYQAFDVEKQQQVALKIMLPSLAEQERFQRRFLQEAETMMQLDAPTIVKAYDSGLDEEGRLYIAMRYVPGLPLDKFLERLEANHESLPLSEAMTIVAQVAEGLDYAHKQGVIHRDVKPVNILVNVLDAQIGIQAAITDFGIARITQEKGITTTLAQAMGTMTFMSPEQFTGKSDEIDGRSDIYSLGILLFQLITGKLPFDAENAKRAVFQHVTESPPHPQEIKTGVPEGK